MLGRLPCPSPAMCSWAGNAVLKLLGEKSPGGPGVPPALLGALLVCGSVHQRAEVSQTRSQLVSDGQGQSGQAWSSRRPEVGKRGTSLRGIGQSISSREPVGRFGAPYPNSVLCSSFRICFPFREYDQECSRHRTEDPRFPRGEGSGLFL